MNQMKDDLNTRTLSPGEQLQAGEVTGTGREAGPSPAPCLLSGD